MLLAIDVGNTQTVIGLFHREAAINSWRVATQSEQTADERAVQIEALLRFAGHDIGSVEGVCLASVVPNALTELIAMCRESLAQDHLFVDHQVKTGITIDYDHPEAVGADRIANAVGGCDAFGAPLIIVDFGTATTVDVISK